VNDRSSDEKLVNFLKQYRPNVPEVTPDFEQKVLAAIETDRDSSKESNKFAIWRIANVNKTLKVSTLPKWALPSAIVAGLLIFWSSYRAFYPAQFQADETDNLEVFLVNNWEGVLNDSHAENLSDRSQTDWSNFAVTTDSESSTNN
jgi:hypothetical protein